MSSNRDLASFSPSLSPTSSEGSSRLPPHAEGVFAASTGLRTTVALHEELFLPTLSPSMFQELDPGQLVLERSEEVRKKNSLSLSL